MPWLTLKHFTLTKPVATSGHHCYLRIYQSASGGCIDENMYKCGHERRDNIQTSIILANKGYYIQLLPDLPSNEVELRKKYLPDVYGNKNPDARINRIWIADFKKPALHVQIRKATISRLIESAARQKAKIAVLNLSSRDYGIQDIKKGIVGALQPDRNRSIEQVR